MDIGTLLISARQEVGVLPESVDFDGANDYLSRASDFTGNADGKTFTFSTWVYPVDGRIEHMYSAGVLSSSVYFRIRKSATGEVQILGVNASGTTILNATGGAGAISLDTFTHLLISIDLANTSNRYVYINDIDVTSAFSWATYTNDLVDFTRPDHYVGNDVMAGTAKLTGRLSHVFLDYTYRDLSIEANRRLFVTADLKPAAGQAALNPIVYFPLTDPTTAHINSGTGGDMALNGTIALGGRGPNQDNCVSSTLDGVADYLLRGADLTGNTDSKLVTGAFNAKSGTSGIDYVYSTANSRFDITWTATNTIRIVGKNSVGAVVLDVSTPVLMLNTLHQISFSFDMSDVGKRSIAINGVSQILTVTTYTDDLIDFTDTNHSVGATVSGASFFNGDLGEVYLNFGEYVNLAASNPFWDLRTKRAKPVKQVITETGVTPLVALPMVANNAGVNFGTGGDFSVNSGPFVGARGASEFRAKSMAGDGVTGYLSRATLPGLSASKTFSFVAAGKLNATGADTMLSIQETGGSANNFRILWSSGNVNVVGENATGTIILNLAANAVPAGSSTNWFTLLVSVDLSTATANIIVNGVDEVLATSTTTDDLLDLSGQNLHLIGAEESASAIRQWWDGEIGFVYFTTDFIDFGQEANRLKFVDAFNYPVDIQSSIDAGNIPAPLLFMQFEDASNLGKNSGSSGDFTINGTITAGGDVNG